MKQLSKNETMLKHQNNSKVCKVCVCVCHKVCKTFPFSVSFPSRYYVTHLHNLLKSIKQIAAFLLK